MIRRIVKGKEISVGVINEVGVLSKVTSFLVNHGINIEAILGAATGVGEAAGLMFITDNNADAITELAQYGFNIIKENDVLIIEIENRPGALKNITELLAQNAINITYIYGTTCSGGCPSKMVISTSDNDLAFGLLSKT